MKLLPSLDAAVPCETDSPQTNFEAAFSVLCKINELGLNYCKLVNFALEGFSIFRFFKVKSKLE